MTYFNSKNKKKYLLPMEKSLVWFALGVGKARPAGQILSAY